ncbi:MAG TPA: hypothetical protein PLC99_04305 [Verrucomicrobiota bacterium]|nr:hypothetical protein [Verrucomicrobiota bacterium]
MTGRRLTGIVVQAAALHVAAAQLLIAALAGNATKQAKRIWNLHDR